MGLPVILSLVTLAVSLLIATAALVYTRRQAVASEKPARTERDRREDEIEATAQGVQANQGADVTVQLSPPTTNGMRKIEVHNAAPVAAEVLTVMYLNSYDGGLAPDTRAWQELSGPLLSGRSREAVAGLTAQSSRRFRVAVAWRDGNGFHRTEILLQV